jgi:hypothetical protein
MTQQYTTTVGRSRGSLSIKRFVKDDDGGRASQTRVHEIATELESAIEPRSAQ